jgi:RimJ/RimL family protein N-acetyltransferase
VSLLFFRLPAGREPISDNLLPADCQMSFWQPALQGLPPTQFRTPGNLVWWGFDKARLFASRDFTLIAIHRGETLLHRLIVTPKWYRFPDMAPRDLQLGDLWTLPEARGQGLARAAVIAACRRFAGRADAMWYIVGEDNEGSRKLIEHCGFDLYGVGRRTAPARVHAFGRFVIDPR